AFAARADTPFGSLGSLLMLGGQWNAQTVPPAYGGPWSALWLTAVLVALTAYLLLARPHRRWPGLGVPPPARPPISALAITPSHPPPPSRPGPPSRPPPPPSSSPPPSP